MTGIVQENGNIFSTKWGHLGQLKETGTIYSIKKGQVGLFKGNLQKVGGCLLLFFDQF
ncbi:hypothetical protein JJE00_03080 [Candidatus Bathyarchaeota archaeon]|nr:hypothetical protein [Candidatus Bathyarchaeota archaeon]